MDDFVVGPNPSVEITGDEAGDHKTKQVVIDHTKAVEILAQIARPSNSETATASPEGSRDVSPFIQEEAPKETKEVDTVDSFDSPLPFFLPRGSPNPNVIVKPRPRPTGGR